MNNRNTLWWGGELREVKGVMIGGGRGRLMHECDAETDGWAAAYGPIWQEEPAGHRLKSAAPSYLDLREKTLTRKRGSCKSLDTETTPATLHCQAAAGVSQEAGNTACTPAGLLGSCVHTYLAVKR
ncbi:hypothetical protein E2C01_032411 [Portunus trituberculatus]|uniref:Uncharacterized protein n=1 Tax=Portunus trituberculatus TaxID=210409 RepID=A0A5B7F2P2_PORTR|nr:hypothetical protein [Portunus trituberculatus]